MSKGPTRSALRIAAPLICCNVWHERGFLTDYGRLRGCGFAKEQKSAGNMSDLTIPNFESSLARFIFENYSHNCPCSSLSSVGLFSELKGFQSMRT
eukprot:1664743-Amphidinium_carterae.1